MLDLFVDFGLFKKKYLKLESYSQKLDQACQF